MPEPDTTAKTSTLTIQLPESLKKNIEALAAQEGYPVNQFLASAAGEKLAVMLTMDYLKHEAAAGRREGFERYLAAVPAAAPSEADRLD
ncbi:MAG: toxin-antitoxin system HicB family antitoxin [Verrucomicrobia bacterium]|nr:toxin-antitoxin system HicB family antitoxin [Verrucomicrobiota bacterium]